MPPAPEPAVGLTRQGLVRFAVGDFRTAEQAFRGVLLIAPHEPMAWNNLALVLIAVGELEQAVPALKRSLSLDPDQLPPWINLAGALMRLWRPEEAEAACAAALTRDPGNAEAWQIRALAFVQAGEHAAAAEAFEQTIALTGETAILRLHLAAARLKSGQFREASRMAARALALDLTSIAALEVSRLCDFLVAAMVGDMQAALANYPSSLWASPENAGRIFRTALTLLESAGEQAAATRVSEAWAARR
jgi:tetratricopeptide (TPR) repeat protein